MNANELIEFQEDKASEARANGFSDVMFMQTATMLRKLDGQLAFRIDAVTKYQAWIKELEISKQSWEIIAKGYSKTIDEQQAEIDKHKALVKDLDSLVGVQGQSGNWDCDPYMCGMFNGMELSLSIFENRDPQYRELVK